MDTFEIAKPTDLRSVPNGIRTRMLELTNPDVMIGGRAHPMSAFRQWIQEERPLRVFFAVEGNVIVGQGLVRTDTVLFGVFVDPSKRRLGIGSALYHAARLTFGEEMWVDPRIWDEGESLLFYKSLGAVDDED